MAMYILSNTTKKVIEGASKELKADIRYHCGISSSTSKDDIPWDARYILNALDNIIQLMNRSEGYGDISGRQVDRLLKDIKNISDRARLLSEKMEKDMTRTINSFNESLIIKDYSIIQ